MAESDFIGPPAAPAAPPDLSGIGYTLAIAGAASKAVGAYFSVISERNQLKSAALSQEFEASVAAINARQAESDAVGELQAGQEAVGRRTLLAGVERATRRAGFAAHGAALGVGSTAEVQASEDLVAAIDSFSLTRQAVRSAANARTQATALRSRSVLATVSTRNLRRTAGALSPFASVASSLLGSGARIGTAWLLDQPEYSARGNNANP